MCNGLLRNEFCEFPWPKGLRWKFESLLYGDSKTLVLAPRGKALYGMLQAWDCSGHDLRSSYSTQWQRLTAAPFGFPPGISVERIETGGQFPDWIGVSSHVPAEAPKFVDYELMSSCMNMMVYYRRSTNEVSKLDIRRELSMIRISEPAQWIVGAELEWVLTGDCG